MTARVKPIPLAVSFVEYQTDKGRDEALLRSLASDLRNGRPIDRPEYYAKVIERYLAGYPAAPKHRQASRVSYWISALYWLFYDAGDTLAANHVAGWCRDRGIERKAQSVTRAARTAGEVRPTHAARPRPSRHWRTRHDPFESVSSELRRLWDANPDQTGLELFDAMCRAHPGEFHSGQLRTLQRRLRQWRAELTQRLVFGSVVDRQSTIAGNIISEASR